ncbi:secondary thiamine-phosphate synthase enzyme YjbQ [Methylonatrum kenyense]|uniref:secondary thiamine-phosphate synthase enzyme YjbQ n=1 Tax=Methylonatrum kenyense TaxID=455253 RepID=UPI0020C0C910|nr:secondary thiamine-phosphate synthase enzyme YjbQ [Methylonatrum kenyense]MCK8515741.1 secondary thiamine-phosphate synthase enzyme YjbQ [Methylonatrum kenyense]
MHRETLTIRNNGRSQTDITAQIARVVTDSGVRIGLCHVFLQHTSASLIISENADPAVGRDLERFISRLVQDGDPMFEHAEEGPDDMAAHIRTILTQTEVTVPVDEGRLDLGTWQGIWLWEHRHAPHARKLIVTVAG